jgi:PAS domain S-box-containing protein
MMGEAVRAAPGGPLAEPVPVAVPAAAVAAAAVVPEPRSQPSNNTPRILVVEDDAKMRRVFELLLGDHWTVETVADARTAIKATRENPPDLVLTDLVLPGMDGFDFLRQIRAEAGTRTLPVIVISGLTEEADRLKALEAGANDYLIKPFSEKELILRVTTHLEMGFLRREAALRESEAQLRAILEGALDAVVGMDASGEVIDWNHQAQVTFGWTREEASGRRLSDLIVPPEFREAHERGLERYFETGEGPLLNRRVEVEGLRKDGTRIPIELAIIVVKGWGFYRFNAFCRDISDRRQADAERNRLLEEAREANRMKDEFLAMLSHELRTPLSAIVGWAHMLRSGGLDEATVARAIETIDRNAKVQNQLIEDILDVSRIVAGKFHLDMRSADLVRVVEAACDTVAPAAAAKGVELRQELDPLVRPCCPAIGDPDRLQQVVWNLLSNAIKFTPKGGTVTVEVRRLDDTSEFEIVVRDTGIGIAPDFLPHIFERFRQAGTGARRQGGLGLGLSIVRHIVEMHGGSVMATSGGEGQGSVFTVRLPILEMGAEDQRVPPISREEGGLEQAPRLDGVRVLVVEDEPDARHLLAAVLQKRGARVFMAASAAEALEFLQREQPDVLLSDIALQDQDGYELIRKVRSLSPEMGGRVPAAALTGYGRLEDRMKALSAGFQLHAAKPVEPAELVAVVASLAGKSSH